MTKKNIIISLILVSIFSASVNSATKELTFSEIKKCYYNSYELEKQKRFREAGIALNPIIKSYPNGYTVNFRLGWLAYYNGNFADAIKYYNKALAVYPSSLEIMTKKMYIYIAQKKWSLVENECKRITRINYYDSNANYWLAYSLRMQKKYNEALKIVSAYISVYPTSVSMLVEFANLKNILEDKKTATEIFQSVIILDPYNQSAQNFLKHTGGK